MLTNVPLTSVQQATLQSINIGQAIIGPITVGTLVLHNAELTMSAAAEVQNMSATVTLHIVLAWQVHVSLPWPFSDINVGDTYDLGSPSFSLPVGNVSIPNLTNIQLNIPTLTANNMAISASPTTAQATNAVAESIQANKATVPAAGFTLTGLTLGPMQGSALQLPAGAVGGVTIGHVHGDPVDVPAITLNNLSLPSVTMPSATTSAPLSVPANLSPEPLGFDAGILKVTLTITPSVVAHIQQLELTNANAKATVSQVVVSDVTLPYNVFNLTLSQLGVDTINVPTFSVS